VTPGPPPVPGGRNPEEREAARREREARRAARRDGNGTSADGNGQGTPTVDRRARRQAEKEERKAAREAFNARAKSVKPEKPPKRAKPARRPAKAPFAGSSESWRERAQRLTASRDGNGPLRPGRAPRAAGAGGRRRLVAGLAVVGGLLALVAVWFLFSLFQPLSGEGRGDGRVSVRVPQGAGVGQIADLLEERGVVGSAFFFQTRARLSGRAGALKPGLYSLGEGMSIGTALDVLAKGPTPDVLNVTVPEGRSRREVSRALPSQLRGDYVSATRRSPQLRPSRYGAPASASLEGFLFPSTYEIKRGRPVGILVGEQLAAFKREFAKVDLGAARRANLSAYEVLTIASMVEREAQQPRERRLVASVIYNRLRDGIPLGIDATVRYVTNNWERPLTKSQLETQSPYNTRVNKGLPPGPIGSPGIDSIRAAAKPARSGYLFYVVKPGTCGEHAFSETDAEFQADVSRYNRERERMGGKSPTKC
jgi:UPF0755 protein